MMHGSVRRRQLLILPDVTVIGELEIAPLIISKETEQLSLAVPTIVSKGEQPVSLEQIPSSMLCPKDHECTLFITPQAGFGCDVCKISVGTGTNMFGCRVCNWDACEKCMEEMTDLNLQLKQFTATIKKGEEPACANALKSIWDLVPGFS